MSLVCCCVAGCGDAPLKRSPVIIDGVVNVDEYSDSQKIVIDTKLGGITTYIKVVEGRLHFGVWIKDNTEDGSDDFVISIGPKGVTELGAMHFQAYIRRDETYGTEIYQGKAGSWNPLWSSKMGTDKELFRKAAKKAASLFPYKYKSFPDHWEVEASISLESLGITPEDEFALELRNYDNAADTNWPMGGNQDDPMTWTTISLK